MSPCISGGLQIIHSQYLYEVQSSSHGLNRAWSYKPSFLKKNFLSRKTQHHQDIQGHTRVSPATSRATKMLKGLEHLTWKKQKVGNAQPGQETLSICLHTQRDIINSNSVMPHDRTRGNRHKLKFRQFQLIIRKLFYSEGSQALLTGCPGTVCSLHPWIFLKPS